MSRFSNWLGRVNWCRYILFIGVFDCLLTIMIFWLWGVNDSLSLFTSVGVLANLLASESFHHLLVSRHPY